MSSVQAVTYKDQSTFLATGFNREISCDAEYQGVEYLVVAPNDNTTVVGEAFLQLPARINFTYIVATRLKDPVYGYVWIQYTWPQFQTACQACCTPHTP